VTSRPKLSSVSRTSSACAAFREPCPASQGGPDRSPQARKGRRGTCSKQASASRWSTPGAVGMSTGEAGPVLQSWTTTGPLGAPSRRLTAHGVATTRPSDRRLVEMSAWRLVCGGSVGEPRRRGRPKGRYEGAAGCAVRPTVHRLVKIVAEDLIFSFLFLFFFFSDNAPSSSRIGPASGIRRPPPGCRDDSCATDSFILAFCRSG